MLNRSQLSTLLLLRKREGTIFSRLPTELILHISDVGYDAHSTISILLQHVAYGELKKAGSYVCR